MKLTKRRALELTRDLWRWMARTGSIFKSDWFDKTGTRVMKHYCPCCEYVFKKTGQLDCSKCPLQGFWGNTPFACSLGPTPIYNQWVNSYGDAAERKKLATRIANAAAKELRKLK